MPEQKQCYECFEFKDKKEFKGLTCKECTLKQLKAKRKERKLACIAYKGGECVHCGYNNLRHPAVYDFHHVNPETKGFNIGSKLMIPWEELREELDKCILLCANCHRIVES